MPRTLKPIIGFMVSIGMFYITVLDLQYPREYRAFLKSFGFAPTSALGYLFLLIPTIFCFCWFFSVQSGKDDDSLGGAWLSTPSFIFVFIANNFWLNAPWISYIGLIYAVVVLLLNVDNILRGANYMFIASPLEAAADDVSMRLKSGTYDPQKARDDAVSALNASLQGTVFPEVEARKIALARKTLESATKDITDKGSKLKNGE